MAILTEDEVREALAGRRAWRRSGDTLVRERSLRDYEQALAFLARIGEAVDDWGRHPDIALMGGNRVRIVVANPNGAGITDAELRLVEKVDEVADTPAERLGDAPQAAVAPEGGTPAEDADAASEPAARGRGRRLAAAIAVAVSGIVAGAAAILASRRR